jgi:hypothetical protein
MIWNAISFKELWGCYKCYTLDVRVNRCHLWHTCPYSNVFHMEQPLVCMDMGNSVHALKGITM